MMESKSDSRTTSYKVLKFYDISNFLFEKYKKIQMSKKYKMV